MANKTNVNINGIEYYRITKVIGHKTNKNGKEVPVRKTFYGKNQKEAEKKYQEFRNKQSQGIDHKKQYFGIVLENWINNFFINDTHYAFGTKDAYIASWKKYLKDSDISYQPLEKITASKVQSFYNNLDCKPSAIKKINNLLKHFYKYLEREGLARDFTAALIIPKEASQEAKENEIITWDNSEIKLILNSFDKADSRFRYRFLIVLAYCTGCRVSELRGLKYSDFDLQEGSVTIKRQIIEKKELSASEAPNKREPIPAELKSSSSYRTLPLSDLAIKEFKIHRAWHKSEQMKKGYRTDYIFTTSSGKFCDKRNIRIALERYYNAIGIFPYRFNENGKPIHKSIHTYRHTFATMLVKNGVSIQVASSLLGHSDINTTAKYYVGVGIDQKREAVKTLESNIAF